jgi:hypothetical protein
LVENASRALLVASASARSEPRSARHDHPELLTADNPVEAGNPLATIEAMKMENLLHAKSDGTAERIVAKNRSQP